MRINAKKRGYNLQEAVQQVFRGRRVTTHHWYNGTPIGVHVLPEEPGVSGTNVKLSYPYDKQKLTIDFGDIGAHSSLVYGGIGSSPLGWAQDIQNVARALGVIDEETEVEVIFTATEDNSIWQAQIVEEGTKWSDS